jgi:FkbM family methyltransferase
MKPLSFVLAASDHGPLIVNRHDFHQLPSGATYGVGFQILTYGCYDPGEIADVLALLNKRRDAVGDGLVVLDCGANIGVHTLEMAGYMTGWGQVLAYEAQERLFYALCGNVALANLFNVQVFNMAVGAESGTMLVPQPNYNKPASFGSLELRRSPSTEYIGQSVSYAEKNMQIVQVLALDSLKLSRLDFLKIDVEGMEMDVLQGARESIAQFRPFMLIEWIKTDRLKLEDFLSANNYSFLEKGGNLEAIPNI